MHDRLQAGLDALERVPVPVIWNDVRSHGAGPEAGEPAPRTTGRARRRPPRLLLVAALLLVACVAGGAMVVRATDDTTTIDTTGSADDAKAEQTSEDGKRFEAAWLASVAAHEVQIETELAVAFAASEFDPALLGAWEAQAPRSDEAIEAVYEQLKSIDVDELDKATQSSVSLILRTSDSPETARSIMGGQVTDWRAMWEIYYNISGSFTEASSRLANSVTRPELSDRAQSWSLAVQIENDVANQRSMLTGLFTDGSFLGPDGGEAGAGVVTYDSLVELVNDEQTHARTLDDLGEADVVTRMRDALSGNDVSLADDFREVALDGRNSTDLTVEVTVWRVASGKKLDRIHAAQVEVADSILVEAGELATAAERPGPVDDDAQLPLVAVAVLLGLAVAGLAFFLGRRTARRPSA